MLVVCEHCLDELKKQPNYECPICKEIVINEDRQTFNNNNNNNLNTKPNILSLPAPPTKSSTSTATTTSTTSSFSDLKSIELPFRYIQTSSNKSSNHIHKNNAIPLPAPSTSPSKSIELPFKFVKSPEPNKSNNSKPVLRLPRPDPPKPKSPFISKSSSIQASEPNFKSFKFSLVNDINLDLKLYWISFNRNPVYYNDLKHNKKLTQKSFHQHTWVLANNDKHVAIAFKLGESYFKNSGSIVNISDLLDLECNSCIECNWSEFNNLLILK